MAELPSDLKADLKLLIIEKCNFEDFLPEYLSDDDYLFGPESPLGLDSLDAIEVVVAVQKKYGVRIGGQETARKVLASIQTLADYVRKESAARKD